ncbi:hypothetical protein L1987_18985 [Smallanthus sonchifolius]|uniref:Uncharacterized protein n=1 Tax=Smallanthus sonchifolius TaxID=185202 RepID=A0ACB9J299_9ASTR|nr:hypothetical protein L1987_18985 [Smallanthus sonchifolius]
MVAVHGNEREERRNRVKTRLGFVSIGFAWKDFDVHGDLSSCTYMHAGSKRVKDEPVRADTYGFRACTDGLVEQGCGSYDWLPDDNRRYMNRIEARTQSRRAWSAETFESKCPKRESDFGVESGLDILVQASLRVDECNGKQLSMPEHSSGQDEANQTIDRRGGGLSGLNSGVGSRPPTGSDNPCDGETNWSRGLVRVGEKKSGKLLSGVEVQGTALSGCSPEKASDRRTKVGGDRKRE